METYFKIRIVLEYGIPALILLLAILFFTYGALKSYFKSRLMEKRGYTYNRALGTERVALEFQAYWKKGDIKINWRKVDSLGYRELKKYISRQENK